jgi:hypothetical protein
MIGWRLYLCVALALGHSGCGDEEKRPIFTAHEGAPCEDCEPCKSAVNGCVCRTCTEYAFDAEKNSLLVCTASGRWELRKKCSGGVLVACSGTSYDLRCLDANGNPMAP